MRTFLLLILTPCLVACTTLPDVPLRPEAPGASVEYPPFLPIDRVTYESVVAAEEDQETEEELEARVAGLKARADRLRNRSID